MGRNSCRLRAALRAGPARALGAAPLPGQGPGRLAGRRRRRELRCHLGPPRRDAGARDLSPGPARRLSGALRGAWRSAPLLLLPRLLGAWRWWASGSRARGAGLWARWTLGPDARASVAATATWRTPRPAFPGRAAGGGERLALRCGFDAAAENVQLPAPRCRALRVSAVQWDPSPGLAFSLVRSVEDLELQAACCLCSHERDE